MFTVASASSTVFFFRPRFGRAKGAVPPASVLSMFPGSAVSAAFGSAFLRARVSLFWWWGRRCLFICHGRNIHRRDFCFPCRRRSCRLLRGRLARGEWRNGSNQFATLQQSPHMFSVDFGVVQSLLSFVGIQGHLPVDLHRKRIVLDTIQRKPARAVIEGRRNRTQQPVLQDPDATDAALIEIQPVIRDPAFGCQGQLTFGSSNFLVKRWEKLFLLLSSMPSILGVV